jgi:hypothetical protein
MARPRLQKNERRPPDTPISAEAFAKAIKWNGGVVPLEKGVRYLLKAIYEELGVSEEVMLSGKRDNEYSYARTFFYVIINDRYTLRPTAITKLLNQVHSNYYSAMLVHAKKTTSETEYEYKNKFIYVLRAFKKRAKTKTLSVERGIISQPIRRGMLIADTIEERLRHQGVVGKELEKVMKVFKSKGEGIKFTQCEVVEMCRVHGVAYNS